MGYYTIEGFQKLRNSLYEEEAKYKKDCKKLGEMEKDNNLGESQEFIRARFNLTYGYESKRQDILTKLNQAVIIEQTDEYKNWDGKSVSRKCMVTINFAGEEETYTILGENEADLNNNILSCDALMVKVMLGHKPGDFVDCNGNTIYIESVKRIDNELDNELGVTRGGR